MSSSDRRNPVEKRLSFSVPLTRLAELAAGEKRRWKSRGCMGHAATDPMIFRVELWHTWAMNRARLFISHYCRGRSLPRRGGNERRTKLVDWLIRKHQTLEEARTSGQLQQVDVADQVVGPHHARRHMNR